MKKYLLISEGEFNELEYDVCEEHELEELNNPNSYGIVEVNDRVYKALKNLTNQVHTLRIQNHGMQNAIDKAIEVLQSDQE